MDLELPVPRPEPTVAWLRAMVARFSDGPDHRRRRALAVAELARIDPAELRRRAAESSCSAAEVLAQAMGIDAGAAVADVARAYHPHTVADEAADRAVARLVDAFGGVADELTAARISLLVQSCDATTALVAKARNHPTVEETLRDDQPLRTTRRVRDGEVVLVSLDGHPFGAGSHECPGQAHAIALAEGILARGRT
ncbi:oxidoreductase [Kutzneria sp. NPDC052558]|uniref:oxidoreductase n=1 Tax=Kutzneria sp. NPDC052558 TaxID=3364121 RepID=UPI0037C9F367